MFKGEIQQKIYISVLYQKMHLKQILEDTTSGDAPCKHWFFIAIAKLSHSFKSSSPWKPGWLSFPLIQQALGKMEDNLNFWTKLKIASNNFKSR